MLIWLDFTEFYQVFISYAGLNWFSNGRLSNFNEESFDFEVSILNEYCNLIWFKLNVVIIRHVWKKSKIMKVNVMANDGQLSNCQYWLMALPYSIDLDHLRGQHGHKILDTARGGLFSSCCELTWPWRLTGQDQSNGVTPDRNTCGGDSSTANITKRFTLFHPSSVKYKKKTALFAIVLFFPVSRFNELVRTWKDDWGFGWVTTFYFWDGKCNYFFWSDVSLVFITHYPRHTRPPRLIISALSSQGLCTKTPKSKPAS